MLFRGKQRVEIGSDLADLGIGAWRMDTVAVRRGRTALEVIAFIGSEDAQRVVRRDASGGETVEEHLERMVIGSKLRHVTCLARAGCDIGLVVVVGVGDIGERDIHAMFVHRH